MTTRIEPSASPALTRFFSAALLSRDRPATSIPSGSNRRAKLSRCWRASTVVGAATATCLPARAPPRVGLAVAAAAEGEPVHRPDRAVIVAHRLDRTRLVGGLGEGEAGGEA